MTLSHAPVVFVVPGDLHLTEAGLVNHHVTQWMVDEVNDLIRPDFVQFIGDNVQDGTSEQFRLFNQLAARLCAPWFALAGDHDVQGDTLAARFRVHIGKPTGQYSLRNFRFLRVNTQEARPVGLSSEQLSWLEGQLHEARTCRERVVLFQHNYPYKVFETFNGPGIEEWRQLVLSYPVTAIFTGHTHYSQIANDGRNVAVAMRSIGDPEGGPPGYMVVFVQGDDLAVTYRTYADTGPLVLITHPRQRLLATCPTHVVSDADEIRVCIWGEEIVTVLGQLDEGEWSLLERTASRIWKRPLAVRNLTKGVHQFRVRATDAQQRVGEQLLEFAFDPTGRYTAVPMVWPVVHATKFC